MRIKIGIALLIVIVLAIVLKLTAKYGFFDKNKKADIDISTNDLDIVYGENSAPLTIYLYFRYDCTFCRKFFIKGYPFLKVEYIDKGKVKLVVKLLELSQDNYVLNSLKTAVCINKYGNFEKLHQLLLTDPNVVYTKEFNEVTDGFVDKDDLVAECMVGGKAENYLSANAIEFKQLGLTGTPTFIIHNQIFKGYIPYSDLKNAIEKEITDTLE